MNDLEKQLRESLQRKDPPAGFAGRVLALARDRNSRDRNNMDAPRKRRAFPWRSVAVAAAMLLLVWGVTIYQDSRRRAEEERAKENLMYALRRTGSQLRLLQDRLSESQTRKVEVPAGQQ
jgi:hypothetical protein